MSKEEGFLQRWSRRKTTEAPDAIPVEDPDALPAAKAKAPAGGKPVETPEEEAFDLSKLPSIESLGQHSDYSMFMHKAVPEDLRLQALRRMWTTDPVLAAPDLLDMHQLDYTGNDGIRPLVTPALEAIAAAAREALERAKRAAEDTEPKSDSPNVAKADGAPPATEPKPDVG
jgi:hypothetical protein